MRERTGAPCDRDGAAAAQGCVDEALVDRVLSQPFFAAPPPKSLDRNAFATAMADLSQISVPDGAATLTALTARSVACAVRHLPRPPRAWIVAGGGARNSTLMHMLERELSPASVLAADRVGWTADSVEAQAFAYLAVRSLTGLPITYPTTTGAPQPLRGGVLAHHADHGRARSALR